MVAYTHAIFATAILCQATSVLGQSDATWTTTPFVACMQNACPAFPNGICSHDIVLNCHNQTQGKSGPKKKRTTLGKAASAKGSLEARQGPLSFTTDANPECDQDTLPKNFVIVSDLRADANHYCQTMKTDLLAKGAGYISQNLSTAVTKSANELHGNKAVLLSLVLTAYPPALAAFTTLQNADTAVIDACTSALVALNTKGQGCTTDINWYNAGKAHGETSTGARPGNIGIANQAVDWMNLAVNYLNPNGGN